MLLREFARPNQEWADKVDYIEFLYTDEAEHQEEIQRLWENRSKRGGTLIGTGVIRSFFMSPFVLLLLDCELHFLYCALVNIAEDKGIAQRFALRHRLLYVGHLALGQYVLEEEARMIARHKAYLIGKR